MMDDYNGWNDAPETESEAVDEYAWEEVARPGTVGEERTMAKRYEGLPAAANMQQSIILAQRQIARDLERRARGADTPRSIDPGARLIA